MPLPPRRGLYDPALERDACGLGFVADLRRPATHDVVVKGCRNLAAACPSRRGRLRSLHQRRGGHPLAHPARPLRARARPRGHRAAERRATTASPSAFSRATASAARPRCASLEDAVRHHNQKVIGWRDVPVDDERRSGRSARASMPALKQLFIGRMCPTSRLRADALHDPQARRAVEPPRLASASFYIASLSSKTVVYKGLSLPERLDAFYLDLREEETRSKHRARSLALQHEHVPHLGARAPLPAHRAQRRDQHAPRQPDLDARARGAPRERSLRRAPRRLQAHHPPRRERLGVARQRRRLSRRRRAQLAARDDDARARGVGGAGRHAAREARVLRVPRVARRAVGRAGGARVHRRHATSARRSTATASGR